MNRRTIKINGKELKLMKAHIKPNYKSRTVLSNTTFDYIMLWLRNNCNANDAVFYWKQAMDFYNATISLPEESKPLTAYYSCMNAAKALLSLNGLDMVNISHGVSSSRNDATEVLSKAEITYTGSGVLWELSRLLGERQVKQKYKVQDLLYNIPCIHRTFSLSYSKFSELFIPVSDVCFDMQNVDDKKVHLTFKLDQRYSSGLQRRFINNKFEQTYNDETDDVFYRYKKNFKWDIHDALANRLSNLVSYHKKVRPYFHYIVGNQMLWYLKKELPSNTHIIDRSSITLIYGVMHWLSELVRYNPMLFNKLMNSRQNWLIKEFLDLGLQQFIDEISAEIAGTNIMVTGYRKD